MEGLEGLSPRRPPPPSPVPFEPDTEKIKRKLLQKNVYPTPKIVHTLRRKEIQKHNRKLKRLVNQPGHPPPPTHSQKQALTEEQSFQSLKLEYKEFSRAIDAKKYEAAASLVGRPWEGLRGVELLKLARASEGEYGGEKLKRESLKGLLEMFEVRKIEELQWVLDDDIEIKQDWFDDNDNGSRKPENRTRRRSEPEVIRFLVDRLSAREITAKDWKFSRMMKMSGLPFTEGQLLKITHELGAKGSWKQALAVVEWVYSDKEHRNDKSRFVYTKLLAVLGKARRPKEALNIFNMMQGDFYIYPDMAAYRSIAVTLGQAGLLQELINIMESMKQKPSKRIKSLHRKNWDPVLEPDVVIYNAVLNACIPSKQWKGVSWVFKQLRNSGLKPNGATYGLAMEVMLQSGKYELVHELFRKMRKSGEAPKALTYKVLVKAFWEEGKVSEAVEAVRDMEQRGVVGTASVYYELACCLCNSGRWRDAMVQVEKMKRLSCARPLEIAFTGMILFSMDGGHINDCIRIFEHMKDHCAPNIGTINAMLKVYGRNDMFSKAKELFEEIKGARSDSFSYLNHGGSSLIPDVYTYSSMLEASASALQWEYFEYVYRDMALSGYQLDQSKHAPLLVKASRAGKWHLLEHAFDNILEGGEVPDPLLFTELIIQAMVGNDYHRAVTLINAMAYAPFQVGESQWTSLFKRNGERISRESLERLLDDLGSCDAASEATVVNLYRSLRCLCGLGAPKFSGSITFDSTASMDGWVEGYNGNKNLNTPANLETSMDGSPDSDEDIVVNNNEVKLDMFFTNHDNIDGDHADTVTASLRLDDHKDAKMAIHTTMQGFADELEPDELIDYLEEKFQGSSVCKGIPEVIKEATVDNTLTAYEILDTWKKKQRN